MLIRALVAVFAVSALSLALPAWSSDASSGESGCTHTLPPGSFAQSCTDCTMSGTTLICENCLGNPDGKPTSASLDTCSCPSLASTNTIHNNQSVLQCGDGNTGGGGGSSSSGGTHCKSSGESCSSSSECCGGSICNSNEKSSFYHECE